jgi:putative transposase
MKRSKFSEHQIIAILKAVEAGRTVKDVCREHEISEATYYQWKSKCGGMQASDIERLREFGSRKPTTEADLCGLVAGESRAERCDRKKAVTPVVRRELVVMLRGEHGLSERRACAAVNLRRSVLSLSLSAEP